MEFLERRSLSIFCVLFLFQIVSVISPNSEFWTTETSHKVQDVITGDLTCRYRDNVYYPLDLFPQVTCAWCYLYTPPYRMVNGKYLYIGRHNVTRGNQTFFIPYIAVNNTGMPFDRTNEEVVALVQSTFLGGESETEKWLSCCEDAELCCDRMLNETKMFKKFCPRTWDGWLCWSDAPAYSNQKVRCPWYIYSSDPPTCRTYARKECLSTGEWYYDVQQQQRDEHTDYTSCSINNYVIQRTNFHIAMHSVSLVTSLPALAIFFYFRSLRNQRFIIHRNLVMSLIFHNVSVILLKSILVLGELEATDPASTPIARNTPGCKLLVWLDKYATMVVFAWMLCEGLYLHRTIAAAFQEKQRTFTFYIIGWAGSLVPTVSWAIAMSQVSDFVCWLTQRDGGHLIWIVDAPRVATLIVNLLLLVDIVRVLYTKLRAVNTDDSTHIRKMTKATIILIPIFGVQFLVTGVKPDIEDCFVEQAYYFIAYLVDGLQGFVVTLVYCYLNMEVRQQVLRLYNRIFEKYNFQSETRQTHAQSNTDNTARRMTLSTVADNPVSESIAGSVPVNMKSPDDLRQVSNDVSSLSEIPTELAPSASVQGAASNAYYTNPLDQSDDPIHEGASFSSDTDSFESTEA